MIPLDAVAAAGVHHRGRADDIGLQEDTRILDGPVHMALRREIDHDVRRLPLKQLVDQLPVADVPQHKPEVRVVHDPLQGGQVPGVGQLVQADNPIVRILLQHVKNEIGSDKSGAAGHNDGHEPSPFLSLFCLTARRALCRKTHTAVCIVSNFPAPVYLFSSGPSGMDSRRIPWYNLPVDFFAYFSDLRNKQRF